MSTGTWADESAKAGQSAHSLDLIVRLSDLFRNHRSFDSRDAMSNPQAKVVAMFTGVRIESSTCRLWSGPSMKNRTFRIAATAGLG